MMQQRQVLPPVYAPREPFGGVRRRRRQRNGAQTPTTETELDNTDNHVYQHNTITAALTLPALFILYYERESIVPLLTLLYVFLSVYVLDLSALDEGMAAGIWVGFFASSLTLWVAKDYGGSSFGIIGILADVAVETILMFCVACWANLQSKQVDAKTAVTFERMIHSLLPLSSPYVIIRQCQVKNILNIQSNGAAYYPFLFALLFFPAIILMGNAKSSYFDDSARRYYSGEEEEEILLDGNDDISSYTEERIEDARDTTRDAELPRYNHVISAADGRTFTYILLFLPTSMHIAIFRQPTLSLSNIHKDDIASLVLITTLSYLLHFFMDYRGWLWWKERLPTILKPPDLKGQALFKKAFLVLISFAAVLSFQYLYLIPISVSISTASLGPNASPPWILNTYLSSGLLCILPSISFRRPKNYDEGPIYQHYFRYIFRSMTILFIGLSISIPVRSLVLLLVVSNLSLFYMSFSMLRHVACLLLMVVTVSIYLGTYQFDDIGKAVFTIPGVIKLDLSEFSNVVMVETVLIILLYGMGYMEQNKSPQNTMKRRSIGFMFVVSSISFLLIEGVLLYKIYGNRIQQYHTNGEDDMIRSTSMWIILTSIAIPGLSESMYQRTNIGPLENVWVKSFGMGKTLGLIICYSSDNGDGFMEKDNAIFVETSLFITMLLFLLRLPFSYAQHNREKSAELKSLGGKIILVHSIIMFLVIAKSMPMLVQPFIMALSRFGQKRHYGTFFLFSEIVGCTMSLWGAYMLSLVTYLFPNKGLNRMRKLSSFSLMTGLFLLIWPPNTMAYHHDVKSSSQIFWVVSNRGLATMMVIIAIFLALAGSSKFQRNVVNEHNDGKSSNRIVLRLVLFGCFVSFFIMQFIGNISMFGKAAFLILSIIILSLGMATAVQGYTLGDKNFYVSNLAKFSIIGCPFLVTTIIWIPDAAFGKTSSLHGPNVISFSLLLICTFSTLVISIALRHRKKKTKETRALCNFSILVTWLLMIVIIYRHYGLVGVDVNTSNSDVMGIPTSIVFTFVSSLILCTLEGEPKTKRKPFRTQPIFGIPLPYLSFGNLLYIASCATVSIYLSVSLYTVLLRGCGWFGNHPSTESIVDPESIYRNSNVQIDLHSIVMKNLVHNHSIEYGAKLASCSFWTSDNIFLPCIHLIGVLGIIPSLYLTVTSIIRKTKNSSTFVMASLPLNIIPLIKCRGIPSLTAAASMNLGLSFWHFLNVRTADKNGRFRN